MMSAAVGTYLTRRRRGRLKAEFLTKMGLTGESVNSVDERRLRVILLGVDVQDQFDVFDSSSDDKSLTCGEYNCT